MSSYPKKVLTLIGGLWGREAETTRKKSVGWKCAAKGQGFRGKGVSGADKLGRSTVLLLG